MDTRTREAIRYLGYGKHAIDNQTFSLVLEAFDELCLLYTSTVPMALLKEAAEVLIDIHGQHEHQSLLYKKNHLGIVDAFAKSQVSELKEEVSGLYKSYRNACKELEEADMDEEMCIRDRSGSC